MVERNIDVVDARGSSPLPPTIKEKLASAGIFFYILALEDEKAGAKQLCEQSEKLRVRRGRAKFLIKNLCVTESSITNYDRKMIILSIETSCDETAISLVSAKGGIKKPEFKVLADMTISQIKIHQKYGGVFPNLAKREHQKNLVPILEQVLKKSGLYKLKTKENDLSTDKLNNLKTILEREPELLKQFLEFIPKIKKPKTRPVRSRDGSQREFSSNRIDAIAVTQGPGLEPALWVGINFAKALSLIWDIPIIPVNHMEGHIVSPLISLDTPDLKKVKEKERVNIKFPALALLISGGHTELVEIKKWGEYKIVGKTRDDAVGECFDKVARMLGLPYPGGPEISALADLARTQKNKTEGEPVKFPRPMLNSPDLDFSFSGLKTSVLYFLQKQKEVNEKLTQAISLEFEEAVTEVLVTKTKKAIQEFGIKSLIVGGGVSANKHLRKIFEREFGLKTEVYFPSNYLSTDNALMIAVAGYLTSLRGIKTKGPESMEIKALGNMTF